MPRAPGSPARPSSALATCRPRRRAAGSTAGRSRRTPGARRRSPARRRRRRGCRRPGRRRSWIAMSSGAAARRGARGRSCARTSALRASLRDVRGGAGAAVRGAVADTDRRWLRRPMHDLRPAVARSSAARSAREAASGSSGLRDRAHDDDLARAGRGDLPDGLRVDAADGEPRQGDGARGVTDGPCGRSPGAQASSAWDGPARPRCSPGRAPPRRRPAPRRASTGPRGARARPPRGAAATGASPCPTWMRRRRPRRGQDPGGR